MFPKNIDVEFQSSPVWISGSSVIIPVWQAVGEDDSATEIDIPAGLPSHASSQFKSLAVVKKFKGKSETILELLSPFESDIAQISLIGCGEEAKATLSILEKCGGKSETSLLNESTTAILVLDRLDTQQASHFISGFLQRHYRFDVYRTDQKEDDISALTRIIVIHHHADELATVYKNEVVPVVTGVCLARDLVNEPANILHPEEFASRCKDLKEFGLKISILGESEMKKLGMHALLGVGQGSRKESQLVVMEWKGSPHQEDAPVAFVGKGVCFDTGGISIKPALGMEEMTMDMGGAAAVTGTMLTLALRKAKINAVGVIGLVENMPDGNAQRPGDVVTSMSGQTIEVINTDAEGRLVLADALHYTHTTYNPRIIIDLATLTGAIIMALANEYAGLFSNNEELTQKLIGSGKESGDALWAFPMGDVYNKSLKSRVADMANISGSMKGAGSIIAACFLERFVPKETPWAHLDIAGTAYVKSASSLHCGGGTGYGVRLLNELVKKEYEAG